MKWRDGVSAVGFMWFDLAGPSNRSRGCEHPILHARRGGRGFQSGATDGPRLARRAVILKPRATPWGGKARNNPTALKGRSKGVLAPLQGFCLLRQSDPQGVALGLRITALRAEASWPGYICIRYSSRLPFALRGEARLGRAVDDGGG